MINFLLINKKKFAVDNNYNLLIAKSIDLLEFKYKILSSLACQIPKGLSNLFTTRTFLCLLLTKPSYAPDG